MNLLTDPLLRVTERRRMETKSLPALLAALGRDDVDSLPGLQKHQEDSWHVFLCYLGAAILSRKGDIQPGQDEAYWESGLRLLAGDAGDAAWCLVTQNPGRPAFMQPPLPEEDHLRLKPKAMTPDELDVLVTAKNHDVKSSRAKDAHPDEWIYALVNLQTMSGYMGRGNFGIARMNSGFGNRMIVELTRSDRMGVRWRDAIPRLLSHRERVLQEAYNYDAKGLVLVWTVPWDGATTLPLPKLDPFFVEVCRRVRLTEDLGYLVANDVPCAHERIDSKHLLGVVGDPWLPVDLGLQDKAAGPKALTVSAQGLTVEMVRRLVFGDRLHLSDLQRPVPEWGPSDLWLTASVLVRGQGKTEGFFTETVRIPQAVRPRLFGPPDVREDLVTLSKSGIEAAAKVGRVLRQAMITYLEGGQAATDHTTIDVWWQYVSRRFESAWRSEYFPWLWEFANVADRFSAEVTWVELLRDMALLVMREAERSMPRRAGRLYRSQVEAERTFYGMLYSQKYFPWMRERRVSHEPPVGN